MRVVAPQAHVDYGLANIIGFDSTEVSAEATVQIRKPLPDVSSVLPMWLPQTCVYGPLAGDDAANPPPDASPEYSLNTPRANHTTGAISPATTAYASVGVTVSITIDDIASGKTGAIVRFTFGDTTYIDYRVTWATATTNSDDSRTVTVGLDDVAASRTPAGASVVNSAGTWEVWPLIPDAAAPLHSPCPSTCQASRSSPSSRGMTSTKVSSRSRGEARSPVTSINEETSVSWTAHGLVWDRSRRDTDSTSPSDLITNSQSLKTLRTCLPA